MTFTALFGLYYFSFVAGDVVIYPFINVILPEDFKADLMPTSFISHVCKMNNATNLISACIYFYALFFAYKVIFSSPLACLTNFFFFLLLYIEEMEVIRDSALCSGTRFHLRYLLDVRTYQDVLHDVLHGY